MTFDSIHGAPMSKNNMWEDYIVQVHNPELGFDIPLCGLCGNSGIVDTTSSAKWKKKKVGIKSFCICPNGQCLKEDSK